MEILTLDKAGRDRGLVATSHVDPASQDFIDILNESTRRLMLYGNWWGTVAKAQVRTCSGEIGWPRWVGTILALNPGCRSTRTPPANYWGEFLPMEAGDIDPSRCWRSSVSAIHDGVTPVFQQIPTGSTNWIRAYPYQDSDVGKSFTLYGIDINGNNVRSQINGIWQEGVVQQLAKPFTQFPFQMRKITRVRKDFTDGPLVISQYDPYYKIEFEMSVFQPDETEPSYRHTIIPGFTRLAVNGAKLCAQQVTIIAKVEFVPVRLPGDWVQIGCLGAHKLMFAAIALEESESPEKARGLQAAAVRELNRELRDKYPLDTTQVSLMPDGTATRSFKLIGRQL